MNTIPTTASEPSEFSLANDNDQRSRNTTDVGPVGERRHAAGSLAVHLDELVERCMGNVSLAMRLLEESPGYLVEDFKHLVESGEDADPREVATLAHRLKGAAANVGAHQLSDVLARIERQGRSGEWPSVPDPRNELESEWNRYTQCVATMCGQHQPNA